MYDTLPDALADVDLAVAFTRWVAGRSNAFYDMPALTQVGVLLWYVCVPKLKQVFLCFSRRCYIRVSVGLLLRRD